MESSGAPPAGRTIRIPAALVPNVRSGLTVKLSSAAEGLFHSAGRSSADAGWDEYLAARDDMTRLLEVARLIGDDHNETVEDDIEVDVRFRDDIRRAIEAEIQFLRDLLAESGKSELVADLKSIIDTMSALQELETDLGTDELEDYAVARGIAVASGVSE